MSKHFFGVSGNAPNYFCDIYRKLNDNQFLRRKLKAFLNNVSYPIRHYQQEAHLFPR